MKPPSTRKGQLSSARILDAALALFAERGFAGTTMQDIATRADVAVGLAYKFFPGKDALVLAYYEQLSGELEAFAQQLPKGPLAARYAALVRQKLERLKPYRRALHSLAAVALDSESEVGVMGAATARVRARNAAVYRALVAGSDDVAAGDAPMLAKLLYAGDLLLVLSWLQDRSADQHSTGRLITFAADAIRFLPKMLWLPGVKSALERADGILGDLLRIDQPPVKEDSP